MVLPTRKLLLLLLIPALIFLLVRGPTGAALGIGLNLAILTLALIDLAISPAPGKLTLERRVPTFLSLGAANSVGWDLRNASRLPLALEVRDDLSDELERDVPSVTGLIRPLARASLTYHVRPRARGLHELGDIHLRCRSLLGLLLRQWRIPAHTPVKVYPNVANLARYELAMQRHRATELGLRAARLRDKGSQFESLRDYAVGDDPTDIAWKATARRGRLIVRNYEAERSQNVLLVLDCGRLMTTEVQGLSLLDYAINAAVLMTYVAAKQHDSVGLLAFSDRIETYVPAVRGKAAVRRVTEALYRLKPSLAESNFDLAGRFLSLRYRKRSLILIITDVIDRDASAMLLRHAARFARHHVPLCVTLRNREVESLAQADPHDARACYTQYVALDVLERRRDALAQMRRAGVDVLDVDPTALNPGVVSRYLWLKRNRRI